MIVVAIVGILAAIAIPNMMKYQARSKQSEARTNLKAYFTVQRNYFAEKDSFSADFSILGFSPERGNRYAYYAALSPAAWITRALATLPTVQAGDGIEVDCWKLGAGSGCTAQPVRPSVVSPFTVIYATGVTGPSDTGVITGPSGAFVLEARGTIDNDVDADIWLISSGTIAVTGNPCADKAGGVPGIPVPIFDDVSCP